MKTTKVFLGLLTGFATGLMIGSLFTTKKKIKSKKVLLHDAKEKSNRKRRK